MTISPVWSLWCAHYPQKFCTKSCHIRSTTMHKYDIVLQQPCWRPTQSFTTSPYGSCTLNCTSRATRSFPLLQLYIVLNLLCMRHVLQNLTLSGQTLESYSWICTSFSLAALPAIWTQWKALRRIHKEGCRLTFSEYAPIRTLLGLTANESTLLFHSWSKVC